MLNSFSVNLLFATDLQCPSDTLENNYLGLYYNILMNNPPEVLADDHQQYLKEEQAWGLGSCYFYIAGSIGNKAIGEQDF